MTKYVFFLIFAVLFNAGSNIFFKYSSRGGLQEKVSLGLIAVGLLVGAVNALFYARSLRGISLNIAYPIFSAGSVVLITLISILLFRESITILRIVGIGLISLGVVFVSL